MAFTKIQRNEIFETIMTAGIDPALCHLRIRTNGIKIKHIPSGSFFSAEEAYGDDYNIYAEISYVRWSDRPVFNFDQLIDQIYHWVKTIIKDSEIPDLWLDLKHNRKFLSDDRYKRNKNTPFTFDEQRQVVEKVREIQNYIEENYDLSAAQLSHVESMLEEAATASERLGRKDWILLFSGTLSSLIITDFLPPQAMQHALIMILNGLAHIFGFGGPQVLPPL